MVDHRTGLRATWVSVVANPLLALVKIVAGVAGNSYALVADGIESTADVFSSLIVWKALRVSTKPADEEHPYGHGKAESLAGIGVALGLMAAALAIAVQSVREIVTPHHAPAPFTLAVLLVVIVMKELLFRFVGRAGAELGSSALQGDAWHHRSDAITSAAAFIGITVALIGGDGYESADDWAALLACIVIAHNGVKLLQPALNEIMDATASASVIARVRELAGNVEGVRATEKLRVRKSGLGLLMDIHVIVDGELSVRVGHEIAHRVKDALLASELPVEDVVVHIEPR
ncbi:MAG: cation diffusion facilitator family transporter [Opitutaceae bacterium]